MYKRQEIFIQVLVGKLDGRNHLKDLCVHGKIILKLTFKKWNGETRAGLIWLRTGTFAGCL
jgi:hypothetical protein